MLARLTCILRSLKRSQRLPLPILDSKFTYTGPPLILGPCFIQQGLEGKRAYSVSTSGLSECSEPPELSKSSELLYNGGAKVAHNGASNFKSEVRKNTGNTGVDSSARVIQIQRPARLRDLRRSTKRCTVSRSVEILGLDGNIRITDAAPRSPRTNNIAIRPSSFMPTQSILIRRVASSLTTSESKDVTLPGQYSQPRLRLQNTLPNKESQKESEEELGKQLVRWKYLSLGSWESSANAENTKDSLDEFSRSWSIRYGILSVKVGGPICWPWGTESLAQRLAGRYMDRRAIIRKWCKVPAEIRKMLWYDVMLWVLQNSPNQAIRLLDASINSPLLRPARHVAEDCLTYIAKSFLERVHSPDPLVINTIYRLICDFAEASVQEELRVFPIPQVVLSLFLQNCDGAQSESVFKTLRRQGIAIHHNTLLHFMDKSVKTGNLSMAFRVLHDLFDSDIDLDSDKFHKGCVTLLRGPFDAEDRYDIQSHILERFVKMGMRQNVFMYNVIILNAIEAGDYHTAWDMYATMREKGLEPNAVTYSIVSKAAKVNIDGNVIEHIIHDAEKYGILPGDDRLVLDLLHAKFVIELRANRQSVFTALMQTFRRYCEVLPLQQLGMLRDDFESDCTADLEVTPPAFQTIGLMILAYLRQNQDSDVLLYLYTRYNELVEAKHPIVAKTAQSGHVYSGFIMAFGRRAQTLHLCTDVLKHMLQLVATGDSDFDSEKASIVTVQTWSILIAAYIRHGQKLAAEKVLAMMQDRGMQPNNFTWNTLISGYAALQDADAAAHALKRMEAAGFEVDAYTLSGLGRVTDRSSILKALKEAGKDDLGSGA